MSIAMRTARPDYPGPAEGAAAGPGDPGTTAVHARPLARRAVIRPADAPSTMTSASQWLLLLGLGTVVAYATFVGGLAVAGRSDDARALAGFIPDCIVLFRRLLGDSRIPRRRRAIVVALIGYLALPFDVVPDFIPVAGQLDDAVVVALALRAILRGGGPEMVEEHWPGPRSSLSFILRLAGRAATA
jgi:uncharacterized membrane protein YkvA (DUF1232 family)